METLLQLLVEGVVMCPTVVRYGVVVCPTVHSNVGVVMCPNVVRYVW